MRLLATLAVMMAGPALADPPATVQSSAASLRPAPEFRLRPLRLDANPMFRIDDPRSSLRSGYGGSMIDLFPFAGGNVHFSGGPRLFGRAGRRRSVEPENLLLLPAFRGGPKLSRRLSPAMLVGYGRTVERGLAFGADVGMVLGRIVQTPDRLSRSIRQRVESVVVHEHQGRENAVARVTALYRF